MLPTCPWSIKEYSKDHQVLWIYHKSRTKPSFKYHLLQPFQYHCLLSYLLTRWLSFLRTFLYERSLFSFPSVPWTDQLYFINFKFWLSANCFQSWSQTKFKEIQKTVKEEHIHFKKVTQLFVVSFCLRLYNDGFQHLGSVYVSLFKSQGCACPSPGYMHTSRLLCGWSFTFELLLTPGSGVMNNCQERCLLHLCRRTSLSHLLIIINNMAWKHHIMSVEFYGHLIFLF